MNLEVCPFSPNGLLGKNLQESQLGNCTSLFLESESFRNHNLKSQQSD